MSKATKRKHVTKEAQEDLSVPKEPQIIVKLVDSRGNNLHEVIDSSGDCYLVSMPVKFRKNIWVKRGDYVLVEPIEEGDKVKAEITKILTKEHIKFYRSQGCWPNTFDEKIQQSGRGEETQTNEKEKYSSSEDEIPVNTNRRMQLRESNRESSSSSSDTSDSD